MILAFVQLVIFIAGCEYYVMNLLTVKKKKKKKTYLLYSDRGRFFIISLTMRPAIIVKHITSSL